LGGFWLHGSLTARTDRLREIGGPHPDLGSVFEAIRDSVEVPLEVVSLFDFQPFPRKRLDGVARGDFETLTDRSPIREEEAALRIAGVTDDTLEDSTVVGTTDELENDFEHLRLPTQPFL